MKKGSSGSWDYWFVFTPVLCVGRCYFVKEQKGNAFNQIVCKWLEVLFDFLQIN